MLDIVKTGAKGTAVFIFEHTKFTLPGVLLSLILAIFALSFFKGAGTPGARAGGAGAMLALIVNPSILAWLVLAIGFPFLYIQFGNKRGLSKLLQLITRNKKDALTGFVVEKFMGFVQQRKPDLLSGALNRQQDWIALFDQFLDDKQSLPKPLRRVARYYAHKLDLAKHIGVSTSETSGHITTEQLTQSLTQRLGEKFDDFTQPAAVKWWFAILATHIAWFFALRYWLA